LEGWIEEGEGGRKEGVKEGHLSRSGMGRRDERGEIDGGEREELQRV
jgi:hypothetical protein